jgi:hypothetical protein
MAETLQDAFNKAIQRFIVPDESDEEISIEYATAEVERKRPRVQSHSTKSSLKKDDSEVIIHFHFYFPFRLLNNYGACMA